MTKKFEKKGNGEEKPGIEFPCDFSIKIMGKSTPDFTDLVLEIVRQHFPKIDETKIQKRFSQFTNYMSLTVTVRPENQEQLDNLYRHLTGTPEILIVL